MIVQAAFGKLKKFASMVGAVSGSDDVGFVDIMSGSAFLCSAIKFSPFTTTIS